MASITLYDSFYNTIQDGSIDLDTDVIKVALLTSSYTPSAAHDAYDDVSSYEVANGNGYTTGGATLGSKTIGTVANGVFDAADVQWSASTITARYAAIYKYDETPGNAWLIGYIDFGSDQSSDNGSFTISWNASGILKIQAAA